MRMFYEPVAFFDGLDDVLIGPVPVGAFTIRHDFPADNAKAPDVAGRCEFAESNRFGSRPSYRDFTTLRKRNAPKLIN